MVRGAGRLIERTPLAADPTIGEVLGRTRFPPHPSPRCGVSGGPDSTALLILAVSAGLKPVAVHVDHGTGRTGDADYVRDLAADLGSPFELHRAEVAPGPNFEARARAARHHALGPDTWLGHTADDQAETMLLALLRGAARDGLAGMAPDRRPLLGLRRADTEAVCAAAGVTPRRDPTNSSPQFRRNRVRHQLLPLLADVADRDPIPVLARQADIWRDENRLLDDMARAIDPTDAAALSGADSAVARRAVRHWLRAAGGDEVHPPDSAAVERVLGVARGSATGTEIAGGWTVRRTDGRLRLEAPGSG